MSPEAQRIAIAEACGWTDVRSDPVHFFHSGLRHPDKLCGRKDGKYWGIPDHLSDLNAMHEAEKLLDDDEVEWAAYRSWLYVIVPPHTNILHATAAQRAEALLRTLGKWQDAP